MTVSSDVSRKGYPGNGSVTSFATEFRFLQDSDLKVILTVDATGVEAVQTLNSDYTVTGIGLDAGGTVTMIVAPEVGETLTIKRNVPLTQGTDYVENDDFPAESHEEALDKLTMIAQQLQEESDRSLKLTESQQSSGLTIPAPATGKFLQWDDSGNLLNVDLSGQGLLVVGSFGETLVASDTSLEARTILDVYSTSEIDLEFAPLDSPVLTGTPVAPTPAAVDNSTAIATTEFVGSAIAGQLNVNNLMHIQDQKTSGTEGGTFTSGAWQTRTLNTITVDNVSGSSLLSNVITLPAGDYWVEAYASAYDVSLCKLRLRNTTDGSDAIVGSSDFASSADNVEVKTVMSGFFTIASAKDFELQHRCSTTRATDGFGNASSFGVVEVYSSIKIWKVA